MKIQGVTDSVTNHLRVQIITGQLEAGAKLNELGISGKLGISRPPLREAFRKLEHENLIVGVPRKGSFVAPMSLKDCEHIYFSRETLECAVIEIYKEENRRRLPLVEKAIESGFDYPESISDDPEEMLAYFEVMSAFHTSLVQSSENPWIIHLYRSLRSCLARYQVLYLNLPGSRQVSLQEHAAVFEHIVKGQFEDAREILKRHIQRIFVLLKEKIKMNGDLQPE